jgi:L-histidine N-alpha-methyltransferase
LPEYYLTAREREILLQRVAEIARITRAETLIELGSGTSEKTRLLLQALAQAATLRWFVPFDFDAATLQASAEALSQLYPTIQIEAIAGDFEQHLHLLPRRGRRLIAFLGSTIGNLKPPERYRFYSNLAAQMSPGDALLLGMDLVKNERRLVAAYNDSQGVTAEFNRNILHILNREVGANFNPTRFEHVARFDAQNEWIEMILRSSSPQRVRLAKLGIQIAFAAGEEMRTEVSAKFRRESVEAELKRSNLHLSHWWTDAQNDYALSLSVRAGE